MFHFRMKGLFVLLSVSLLAVSLVCLQGCRESRERIKNEEMKQKQNEQRLLQNQKIQRQNQLNEKIYLIALKFRVEPQTTRAILDRYLSETRDFDLYDLNPGFFRNDFMRDIKLIDYLSVIESISHQQGVPKETVAAIIIEFKTWVRIEDILERIPD